MIDKKLKKKIFNRETLEKYAVFFVVLSGLAIIIFNLYELSSTSYWFDELYTLTSLYKSWSGAYVRDLLQDGIPLGHFAFLKIVTSFFDDKAIVARYVTGALFVIIWPVIYFIDHRRLRSAILVGLIALSPGVIYFGSEVRPYTLKILFYILSCHFLSRVINNWNNFQSRLLLPWVLLNFLGMSHHYTFALVPLAQLICWYLYRKEGLLKVALRKSFVLSLIASYIPMLQIIFTDFSRVGSFQSSLITTYYSEQLLNYYRPGLNYFMILYWTLITYVIIVYAFRWLNQLHKLRLGFNTYELIAFAGLITFALSLAVNTFIDVGYPRHQGLYYISLLAIFANWVSRSRWALVILIFGTSLSFMTSMPRYRFTNYLEQRKFVEDGVRYITSLSLDEVCVVTNSDWARRFYLPTLSRIYDLGIRPVALGDEQCPEMVKVYLIEGKESSGVKIITSLDDWSWRSQ